MTKRVFLWTSPRCVSTAFERSIMELDNSKIFHEPYSWAYYFGPERQSSRYKHQQTDSKHCYKAIGKTLLKEYDGIDLVFSKDMAYAIDENFDEMLCDGIRNFKHTFLIRDPKKAIPSLYAASVNKNLTGWEYFDPKEGGFPQLGQLYRFITEKLDEAPVIVDADDLLENPEGIMQAYCEGIGVRFDKKILEWEPGPVPDWDVWAGWHENALKSSGFRRQDPNKSKIDASKMEEEERLPNIVMQTIERSMPFYEELYKNRVKAKIDCSQNELAE
eukprot:Seg8401.1 transcript_id=Seg8401.1/GoldUCD/mRNA.D3Y31 product="Branched-chain-amino-acid aminotransferase-like protein 2" protein_id=Seg8401.1/GoldUCD/D3Y31